MATVEEACRLVSFGLVVLIWLVQCVIYPSFAAVEPGSFVAWHARYTRAITWFVGPLMLAQVGLLGRLLYERPGVRISAAASAVAACWIATAALAVPCHDRLQAGGRDLAVIRRLVATNWVRTVGWTLAFVLLLGA